MAAVVLFALMCLVLITVFINSKPITGYYDSSGQDYQSMKLLGKILLNEYMVPFEYASILLLVSMIGNVLFSKKEKTEK